MINDDESSTLRNNATIATNRFQRNNSLSSSFKSFVIDLLKNRIRKLKRINSYLSYSLRYIIEQSRKTSILKSKRLRGFWPSTELRPNIEGLVFHDGNQIYVSKELRLRVLKELHDSSTTKHFDRNVTSLFLKR